jgi:hypothetical protein
MRETLGSDGGVDLRTTMMMIGRRTWSTCGYDV